MLEEHRSCCFHTNAHVCIHSTSIPLLSFFGENHLLQAPALKRDRQGGGFFSPYSNLLPITKDEEGAWWAKEWVYPTPFP